MHYLLHGLNVQSDRPIPGMVAVETSRQPDLTLWLGHSPLPQAHFNLTESSPPEGWEVWRRTPYRNAAGDPLLVALRRLDGSFYRIVYADGFDFLINRTATEVWATWSHERTIADVPSLLLGPIIGTVLRLRGTTSLHASAVAIGGQAILFVGPTGAGKSTLAAAFAVRGTPVLADDTVALTECNRSWFAASGYPRVRLWPASAQTLSKAAGPAALLPPGQSGSTSRYHLDLQADGLSFHHDPLPLGAVYVLTGGESATLQAAQRIAPAPALMALVANSYSTGALNRETRAAEFESLSRIVQTIPISRLIRSTDLASLPDLCEFVLADLQQAAMR